MSDEEVLFGEEKVLDMPALDLMAESKGSYAKYKILCQLRQIEPLDRDTYLSLWNENVDAKSYKVVETFSSLFPQKSAL